MSSAWHRFTVPAGIGARFGALLGALPGVLPGVLPGALPGVLLAALLATGCTERPHLAGSFETPAPDAGRVVTVTGTGRMSLPPSQVTFTAEVNVTAPTPEAAWGQGSARISKLSKALEQAGVRTTDMVMSAIDMGQLKTDQSTNWSLHQLLSVTVTDLARLPGLLAVVQGAGADHIVGARFGISDTRAAGDRARERALVEARSKAEMLAQEVNLRLGAVRSLEEHVLSPDSVSGTLDAPPGAFEVVTRIDVTYELID